MTVFADTNGAVVLTLVTWHTAHAAALAALEHVMEMVPEDVAATHHRSRAESVVVRFFCWIVVSFAQVPPSPVTEEIAAGAVVMSYQIPSSTTLPPAGVTEAVARLAVAASEGMPPPDKRVTPGATGSPPSGQTEDYDGDRCGGVPADRHVLSPPPGQAVSGPRWNICCTVVVRPPLLVIQVPASQHGRAGRR
jgi:hypothetical protein